MQRFPILGLMSLSWKKKKVSDQPLPSIPLEHVQVLYVYGIGSGSGYFQYYNWLKEDRERRLVFLEDKESSLGAFLYTDHAEKILSDEQVHLELFSLGNVEEIVDRFPYEKVEVIAHPAKRGVEKLRLEIFRKTALAHSLRIDRLYGYELFSHFLQNLAHLPGSFYANRMKNAFCNIPAVICGAGPSLQESLKDLQALEDRALILAGGSTLAALSSQGVKIHFGMAIDPNEEEYFRLKNSFAFETPILYSTRVHPKIFQTCSGPFVYMRTGIGGMTELWMEEELGLMGELIGKELSLEAMSVTAVCVAWAKFLGCNPILLNGVDLAYTDGKRYAAGVVEHPFFEKGEQDLSARNQIIRCKNRKGLQVDTAVRWIMESDAIAEFSLSCPETDVINTTVRGLGFKGMRYLSLKKAAAAFQKHPLEEKIQQALDQAKMPENSDLIIKTKIKELKNSLDRLIGHLQVLAKVKQGSSALAEVEIQEEIAFLYLFHDIRKIFANDELFWEKWLSLAIKYKETMQSCGL
jgi:hypothetical protein